MLFIISIYLIVVIWITIAGLSKIEKKENNKKVSIFISVVIAVKNENKCIDKLLLALKNQSYPTEMFEIIIVDDESSDNTLEILQKWKNKVKNLKIIESKKNQEGWDRKIWSLNQGIEVAKGEIILHTDGDCFPEKDWILHMALQFNDIEIGYVVGATPLIGEGFFNKIIIHESLAQDSLSAFGLYNNLLFSCNGRSVSYRKKYFDRVNGFKDISHIVGGDDDLLMHKLINQTHCKSKYITSKNSFVFSDTVNSFKELVSQRIRYASKGLTFYRYRFVSKELKLIIPLLYIVNILVCFSIIQLIYAPNYFFLLIFFIKLISDFIMVKTYLGQIKYSLDYIIFLFLSIVHPFYIIIFSTIAPFKQIKWK